MISHVDFFTMTYYCVTMGFQIDYDHAYMDYLEMKIYDNLL